MSKYEMTDTNGTAFNFDTSFSSFAAARIDMKVIAKSLAHTPRWRAMTTKPYSVAAHSVAVANAMYYYFPQNRMAPLYALLHDVEEAFTGDMPTPLKNALRKRGNYAFDNIASNITFRIHQRFNLPGTMPDDIAEALHWCDNLAASSERAILKPTVNFFGAFSEEAIVKDKKYWFGPRAAKLFTTYLKTCIHIQETGHPA